MKAGKATETHTVLTKSLFLGCKAMYTPVSIATERKKQLIYQILSFSAAKCWTDRSLKNTQRSFLRWKRQSISLAVHLLDAFFWLNLKTFHSSHSIWQKTFQLSFPETDLIAIRRHKYIAHVISPHRSHPYIPHSHVQIVIDSAYTKNCKLHLSRIFHHVTCTLPANPSQLDYF